jgi:hypothetical protein
VSCANGAHNNTNHKRESPLSLIHVGLLFAFVCFLRRNSKQDQKTKSKKTGGKTRKRKDTKSPQQKTPLATPLPTDKILGMHRFALHRFGLAIQESIMNKSTSLLLQKTNTNTRAKKKDKKIVYCQFQHSEALSQPAFAQS